MLGVLAWVFVWWVTGAVPLAVASMAPLFLFPAFGVSSSDAVAKSYMDDVISLVLGSFILALAIEHYHIHRRLALNITAMFCGDPVRPTLLLLGITGTTAFVSTWIHNTACTVMMMPVATGILQRLPRHAGAGTDIDDSGGGEEVRRFSKAVVLGVVYASAIGGMSTLTGIRTPHGDDPLLGSLGHTLLHVLLQEHREGSLCLPRQEPFEKRAQLVRDVTL